MYWFGEVVWLDNVAEPRAARRAAAATLHLSLVSQAFPMWTHFNLYLLCGTTVCLLVSPLHRIRNGFDGGRFATVCADTSNT